MDGSFSQVTPSPASYPKMSSKSLNVSFIELPTGFSTCGEGNILGSLEIYIVFCRSSSFGSRLNHARESMAKRLMSRTYPVSLFYDQNYAPPPGEWKKICGPPGGLDLAQLFPVLFMKSLILKTIKARELQLAGIDSGDLIPSLSIF